MWCHASVIPAHTGGRGRQVNLLEAYRSTSLNYDIPVSTRQKVRTDSQSWTYTLIPTYVLSLKFGSTHPKISNSKERTKPDFKPNKLQVRPVLCVLKNFNKHPLNIGLG